MSGILQMLLAGVKQAVAAAVDPYFNYVTALLHGDGTNGGQNNTFLDSSTNNFTITRNGNTTQGSFSPFSQTGWSNHFDGTGDNLTIGSNSAFNMSTYASLEAFVYFNAFNNETLFFGKESMWLGYGAVSLNGTSGKLAFHIYNGGWNAVVASSFTPVVGTWYHIVGIKDNTTLRIYINGVQQNTVSYAGTVSNTLNTWYTGGYISGSYVGLNGYISNARYITGASASVLPYTGTSFTVPTTPLSALTGTVLLTCQSNRFVDNSTNAFAITRNGDVSVQPFSPFNPTTAYSTSAVGGSGYFDGSGDYLTATLTSQAPGTGDFTYQFWVYAADNTAVSLFDTRAVNNNTTGFTLLINGSSNLAVYTSSTILTGSGTVPLNAWSFVTVTRSGTTLTIYLNGTSQGTVTFTNNLTDTAMRLGQYVDGTGSFTGYIAGFKYVKGSADSASVPTTPPTATTGTQFLCNFTNGAIYDNAAVADYETVGNAQISTSVVKYGTGSMYFDGTGDWLAAPPTSQSDLGSGDFTIECWLYRTASGATFDSGIVSRGAPSTSNGFVFAYTSSNVLTFNFNYAGPIVTGSTAIPINTWTHVAVCRIGTTFKLFVNGNVDGTATSSSSQTLNASDVFYIGRASFDSGRIVTGYIDDLRISKGVARYPYNFTPPDAELPNIGGTITLTADPYYEYTTLLLSGNGTNGAQNNTFVDGSTNNFTITRNGNTTQGSFSPFSQTGWSNYFDGTGDYLTTNATQAIPATGDFTIEAWVYPTVSGPGRNIVSQGTTGTSGRLQLNVHTDNTLQFAITSTLVYSTGTVTPNQWNYVAVTRTGSSVAFYINGSAAGTATLSGTVQNTTLAIGSEWSGDPYRWLGYISNVRISNVVRTITASPTAPFTSDANTVVLTCQSNRFIDNSTNAFAITRNGDVSVQAFSPFNPTAAWSAATNGGSGYFDGSGDYLTVASNSVFNIFNQTNATVEFWFNPNAYSTDQDAVSYYVDGSNFWMVQFAGGQANKPIKFYTLNAGVPVSLDVNQSSTTFLPNQWNHCAFVKSGSTWSSFINGVRVATAGTAPTINFTGTFYIGSRNTTSNLITGYLAGVRITNTAEYYGTTYTVPTAPPTAISGTGFLANFTNGGIYDATAKNDLETVGNAQISTTQSKFGGSSMYFDGTGDYLLSPSSVNWDFGTGDFTVEFWINFSSVGNDTIVGKWGSGNYAWVVQVTSSNLIFYTGNNGSLGTQYTFAWTASTGSWYHVAVTRYGTSLKAFIDGSQIGSTQTNSHSLSASGAFCCIGENLDGGGQGGFVNGYIQDLRITKGIARYTSNFTPPTTAFLTL